MSISRLALGRYGHGVLILATLLTSACSLTSVKIEDERGPVIEARRPKEPTAPPFRSEWQVTPHSIDGHLTWQYCELERSWTTNRVKTVEYRRQTAAGIALLTGGGAVSLAGSLTMKRGDPQVDNTGSTMLIVAGSGLAIAGIVALAGPNGTRTEILSSKREHVLETGSCVPTRDLRDLLLVLKVHRALWRVRLTPQGDAHVEVPVGASVPPDVDMQLIVHRAPAGADDIVVRGQVLETLRLPARAEAAH